MPTDRMPSRNRTPPREPPLHRRRPHPGTPRLFLHPSPQPLPTTTTPLLFHPSQHLHLHHRFRCRCCCCWSGHHHRIGLPNPHRHRELHHRPRRPQAQHAVQGRAAPVVGRADPECERGDARFRGEGRDHQLVDQAERDEGAGGVGRGRGEGVGLRDGGGVSGVQGNTDVNLGRGGGKHWGMMAGCLDGFTGSFVLTGANFWDTSCSSGLGDTRAPRFVVEGGLGACCSRTASKTCRIHNIQSTSFL